VIVDFLPCLKPTDERHWPYSSSIRQWTLECASDRGSRHNNQSHLSGSLGTNSNVILTLRISTGHPLCDDWCVILNPRVQVHLSSPCCMFRPRFTVTRRHNATYTRFTTGEKIPRSTLLTFILSTHSSSVARWNSWLMGPVRDDEHNRYGSLSRLY
jgi:hypothetical protein